MDVKVRRKPTLLVHIDPAARGYLDFRSPPRPHVDALLHADILQTTLGNHAIFADRHAQLYRAVRYKSSV